MNKLSDWIYETLRQCPRPVSSDTIRYSRWWRACNPEAILWHNRHTGLPAVEKSCQQCGKPFLTIGYKRKFCCGTCRYDWFRHEEIKKRAQKIAALPLVKCLNCSKDFKAKTMQSKIKYCSIVCCKRFIARRHYYIRQARKQYERNSPLCRAILTYLKVNTLNAKCFWCGLVAPAIGFQVDHVIPVKLGGSNDDHNLVIACKKCNLVKGSKMPTKEMMVKHGSLPLMGNTFVPTGF